MYTVLLHVSADASNIPVITDHRVPCSLIANVMTIGVRTIRNITPLELECCFTGRVMLRKCALNLLVMSLDYILF